MFCRHPRPRSAAARASTAASPTRSGTSRACRSSAGRRSPVAEEPAERDELAATFRHPGVAGAYRHRPPYPAEVFDILDRIITDRPRRVLDIGAGEGALARPLAGRVDHVDAMDISSAMVRAGRRRPGGTRP